MSKRLSIEGLPELNRRLALATSKAVAAAKAAVADEVETLREDARDSAPRLSGELADGIVGRTDGLDGEVRTTARHSPFVEHGTYKDRAQPFMTPAAERSRRRFPAKAGALIKTAVEGLKL